MPPIEDLLWALDSEGWLLALDLVAEAIPFAMEIGIVGPIDGTPDVIWVTSCGANRVVRVDPVAGVMMTFEPGDCPIHLVVADDGGVGGAA